MPVFKFSSARIAQRCSVLLIVFFLSSIAHAQDQDGARRLHQITLSCDNNAFLLRDEDGYYTSGFFLKYDRVSRKNKSESPQKIFSYELGHMIFNAHSRKILPHPTARFPGGLSEIDRPVTGYLFGKASRSSFYSGNKLLMLGVSVGVIGKNAFGREIQEHWHKVIGIKDHWNWVWDYQLKNEAGINIHGEYAFSLIDREQSWIQVTPITQATFGTMFDNVSQAVAVQIGKFRPIMSSSYWNSRVQNVSYSNANKPEFFFFYRPQVMFQMYNATVQGGMFRDDKGPITSELSPFLFSQEMGVRYSRSKYCIGYHVTLQSREAKSQFKSHAFANIVFVLRF